MINWQKYTILVIIILAFFLRLYRIGNPLADWHSWRQADTAAVARNYVKYGIDLLQPKYDDVSDIGSGKNNPQGYRMVEFPLYGFMHALFYKLAPIINFEATGRMLSIIFSLISLVFLFLIIQLISGDIPALFSALYFAILPYNIFYNRVILPEPLMVMTSLGAVYFFMKASTRFIFLFLSLLFTITALLLKPFAVFLIFPPILFSIFIKIDNSNKKIFWILSFVIYWILSFIPFLIWRAWISQFPEGIPANTWLLNGDGIRFKGAWFFWIFADRIGRLILGYWGLPLLALGLLAKTNKRENGFYFLWLLGILIYLVVVATGNVKHDYYQIIIIPVICAILARGSVFLLGSLRAYGLFLVCFLFMEGFAWYHVRDFFNINHPEIVQAGVAVAAISKDSDKVIAPYGGDTAFLYQTSRKGWPIGGNISDKIENGAKFYVSVTQDEESKMLEKQCQIVSKNNNFVIINLQNCIIKPS